MWKFNKRRFNYIGSRYCALDNSFAVNLITGKEDIDVGGYIDMLPKELVLLSNPYNVPTDYGISEMVRAQDRDGNIYRVLWNKDFIIPEGADFFKAVLNRGFSYYWFRLFQTRYNSDFNEVANQIYKEYHSYPNRSEYLPISGGRIIKR